MAKDIDSLHDKIDNVVEKMHTIDVTMARQEINLSEHMKRTELNEHKLSIFEERIAPALDAYKFVATCFKIIVPLVTLIALYFKLHTD